MPGLALFIGVLIGWLLSTAIPVSSALGFVASLLAPIIQSDLFYDMAIGMPAGVITGLGVSMWYGHTSYSYQQVNERKRLLSDHCYELSEMLGWYGALDSVKQDDEYLSLRVQQALHRLLLEAESSELFCKEIGLIKESGQFEAAADLLRRVEGENIKVNQAYQLLNSALDAIGKISPKFFDIGIKLHFRKVGILVKRVFCS